MGVSRKIQDKKTFLTNFKDVKAKEQWKEWNCFVPEN